MFEKLEIENIQKELKTMKNFYTKDLSPFFNAKNVKQWRDFVYSLEIPEWKKERIWEYLNNDLPFEIVYHLLTK